jgi:hypothetical protein
MRGSISYGSGKKHGLLREELKELLMSRYMVARSGEGIILDEGRRAEALCIVDALLGLRQHEDYLEIVQSLEMSGVLSAKEARHFLGISSRRQLTLERAALPPLPGSLLSLETLPREMLK